MKYSIKTFYHFISESQINSKFELGLQYLYEDKVVTLIQVEPILIGMTKYFNNREEIEVDSRTLVEFDIQSLFDGKFSNSNEIAMDQIKLMTYNELSKHRIELEKLWGSLYSDFKKYEPISLSSVDGKRVAKYSSQERTEFKKNYQALKDKYFETVEKIKFQRMKVTPEYWKTISDELDRLYDNIDNSVKYATELSYLNDALGWAISSQHKKQIQYAIAGIKNGSDIFGNNVFEIIKYNLSKLWYMGAKQFVSNMIRKAGGRLTHKSEPTVAGSVYYTMPNDAQIRISDHLLPNTDRRIKMREQGIGENWVNIVLDEPMSRDELVLLVNDSIREANSENSDVYKYYRWK